MTAAPAPTFAGPTALTPHEALVVARASLRACGARARLLRRIRIAALASTAGGGSLRGGRGPRASRWARRLAWREIEALTAHWSVDDVPSTPAAVLAALVRQPRSRPFVDPGVWGWASRG